MCLTVKSGPHRAKSDIKVLKVLTCYNVAPYWGFTYHPNCTYRLRKRLSLVRTQFREVIQEGFHSFIDKKCVYHPSDVDTKLVEMVIPRGATYYKGDRGDLVSTSIRTGDLKGLAITRAW